MEENKNGLSSLEEILKNTVKAIETSKEQIFVISENAREEKEKIAEQLKKYNQEILEVIDLVDELELKCRAARKELANVSKNFKIHSEGKIQETYEITSNLQIDLNVAMERESFIQDLRKDLQLRAKNIDLTIERANVLITQVSVVYDYLTNEVSNITHLVDSTKEQKLIGYKTILVQEEEKKRIARDIHDGPAQSMANLVLRAEITERLFDNQDIDMARKELKDIKKIVKQNLADVRKIIFDLRPMALDDLGLFPTLKKYIPELMERQGLDINFKIKGKERRFDSSIEIAMFRLIQESINNVISHAKTSKAKVHIEITDSYINVKITDNGKGFNVEEVLKKKEHFGIIGMKERTELFNGELTIESSVENGTKVNIQIPLNERGEIDGR